MPKLARILYQILASRDDVPLDLAAISYDWTPMIGTKISAFGTSINAAIAHSTVSASARTNVTAPQSVMTTLRRIETVTVEINSGQSLAFSLLRSVSCVQYLTNQHLTNRSTQANMHDLKFRTSG